MRDQQRAYYTYRCKYCGSECFKKSGLPSGQSPTKLGNYGSAAVPAPTNYDEEMYESTTISFTAETATDVAYISDSACKFADKHFTPGMTLVVETDSGTNDGTYTINTDKDYAGMVTASVIYLSDSDSLTTENAATAGTVTISRRIKEPSVGSGCSFCGSLASK